MKTRRWITVLVLMLTCIVFGCSKPPEGQIALQGTWQGLPGSGVEGVTIEFSGTQYIYSDTTADYRASGTFTAYPNNFPMSMAIKLTKASSDPAISSTNPWVSYCIYEIGDGELSLGYGEAQGNPDGLPTDFAGVYALETFQRVGVDTDITGDSKS